MSGQAEEHQVFDALAGCSDPAMVVVTTCVDGVRAGCLVGFHSQSSIDPPRYSVWLSKANHTYRVALRASRLAVHFLTVDDHGLAEHFGTRSGEDVDKFAGLRVSAEDDGLPLLDALPHRLTGARLAVLDLSGDHVCMELAVDGAYGEALFEPLRLGSVADLHPGQNARHRIIPAGPEHLPTGRSPSWDFLSDPPDRMVSWHRRRPPPATW